MPGLFGTVTAAKRDQVRGAFTRMFAPSVKRFCAESLVDDTQGWALGRTHLGVLQPAPQLAASSAIHVLLHGDVYNTPELASRCDRHEDQRSPHALFATLYEQSGPAFAKDVDGAYCAAVLDWDRRRLLLIADPVGSYPLYWTTTNDGFVFGSELGAVLRHPAVARALDARALADYLTFGMPLGTKTLAQGIGLVPAGSVLVYDADRQQVRIDALTSIAEAFDPWAGSESDYIEALGEAFHISVTRAAEGGHPLGLSLSGGLDSRAILSAVNGHGPSLATYTLGIAGCADQAIASQLSRIAATNHTFFELDQRYLRDFLPYLTRMVSLTDGMYLSHGLTEMLALDFLSSAPFSVLLRGHGGELAKTSLAWPLHTDEQVFGFTSTDQLVPYLLRRVNYISPNLVTRDLFETSVATVIEDGARASLTESLTDVALRPADLCSYLYLTQHHRRSTIASLEIFRQAVEIRMPFVDSVFLKMLLRAHPDWRNDTRLHRALTRRGNARLLNIRNSNTGAPGDSGPRAEFIYDKLNTVLKRLNVPGYRHYHNFQAWMRDQLLESVQSVLLSRRSLDRGILRESGLRRLLEETRAGRADHSYLLQVLLIVELWQQENL